MGRFILFTGDGKGKSTAAFGLAVRALGNGQKVCVIQFIKSETFITGELLFFRNAGVEIIPCGFGLTRQNGVGKNREGIKKAYVTALEKLRNDICDLIILDELCCVFSITEFETNDVCPRNDMLKAIIEAKDSKNIVVTGRMAPAEFIEAADLVTEMKPLKHYYDIGVTAVKGLEY